MISQIRRFLSDTRRFIPDNRGATMVEYVIMVGMIALIAYAGFQFFGAQVRDRINAQGQAVDGINDSLPTH